MGKSEPTNISDVRPDAAGEVQGVSPTTLPTRGEKRIIPSPIAPTDVDQAFETAYTASGQKAPGQRKAGYKPTGRTQLVDSEDFYVTAAMKPYVDYIVIRMAHRAVTSTGQANANTPPAVYRFLINPATVQVTRSTLDGQAMTRAGWQIGVWGEDAVQVQLSGKTAGQYFAFGLTDAYQPFTESYRNFEQLQMVFENNGYWFEGEQLGDGALSSNFARRRIKMHSDIELIVGNFVWYGMFDQMTFSQSADEPFLMNFNLSFVAWKERYRTGSPYQPQIRNDVYRGHDFSAWQSTATAAQNANPANTANNTANLTPPNATAAVPVPSPATSIAGGFQAPSVTSAQTSQLLPQTDATANSHVPMRNVLGWNTTPSQNFFNGVLGTDFFGDDK